jgi:rhomboid-like protein
MISLIFLPMFSFPIKYGVAGLLLVDFIGVIRKWSSFDHFAHIGGALSGVISKYCFEELARQFK